MSPPTKLAVLLLVLAAMASLSLPDEARLIQELENAAHAPVFGIVALVLFSLVRGSQKKRYLLASLGAVALGIGVEMFQATIGRDAEFLDVLRDAAGAASFLAVHWAFHSLRAASALRWALYTVAAGLMVLVLGPPVLTSVALATRYLQFSRIEDFDSMWTARLICVGSGHLEIVDAPQGFQKGNGDRVARMRFDPAEYSGWGIDGPYPDWSGLREFTFEAYSDLTEPVRLVLRIHDRKHNQEYRDRFNTELIVNPGVTVFHIPTAEIERAPADRRMDLAAIDGIGLFVVRPRHSFVLYFDSFRLE